MFRSCLRPPSILLLAVAAGLFLPLRAAAQEESEPDTTVQRVNAREVLDAGLAEAERTDRLVFLHSGAPWCGWCRRLERWLEREDIVPIFFKDFVDVKIDVDEMEGGKELMDSYNGGYGGVPWLAILRPDGTVVVDSNAPNGRNIGSPQADWEIEHWNTMMRTAAKRITEEEIEYMARTWAEDRGGDY